MKKSAMIRMTAAMLAAACLCSVMTACRETPQEDTYVPGGATLEVSFDHSYRSEVLPMEQNISQPVLHAVGSYILQSGWSAEKENTEDYMLYDPVTGQQHDLFTYADAATETHHIRVEGVTERNDRIEVLYKSYDLEEGTWEKENLQYTLQIYDSSLTLLSEENITERFDALMDLEHWIWDDRGYYLGVCYDENGSSGLYCFDANYQMLGEITGAFSNPHSLFHDADGDLYVLSYIGSANVCMVDPEALSAERLNMEGLPEYPMEIIPGDGVYDLYIADEIGIWGVNTETQTAEEIADWSNSDFDPMEVWAMAMLPDGHFLVAEAPNVDADNITYYKLTERTQEEIDNTKVISMAKVGNTLAVDDLVRLWNRQSTDSRIVVYDYTEQYSDQAWGDNLEKFKNDLVSGIVPDIIQIDSSCFELLANKGILEDLKPWMEQDENFREEDYLMNVFESLEYKDTLPRIGFNFSVYAFMAKSEFIGKNTCLEAKDIPALAESLPEDMTLFDGMSREKAYSFLCTNNLGAFVDSDAGECRFDSAAFVDILEYCNSFKAVGNQWLSDEMAYRKDRALLYYGGFLRPYSYHEHKAGRFDNAEVELVGMASMSDEGNGGQFTNIGTIGMCRESLYKEEIWDFFMFCLSEETQDTMRNGILNGMPVNRASLQKYAQEALEEPSETDGNAYFTVGNEQIYLGAAGQEEIDVFMEYIEEIDSMIYYNDSISAIMDEETQMYFAGDQTAEQAAKNIQSRVSIYLSEQE